MSTLISKLEAEHSGDYNHALTPVVIENVTSVNGCMLEKPLRGVFAKEKDRAIHLHGDSYQLIPYETILSGVSNSLDEYGVDLNGASVKFDVTGSLSRMRLRVLFGDDTELGSHLMQYDPNDKLKFGIEIVSSYDASVIFKLQTMFLRLICDNGMKSLEPINSSLRKHTLEFNVSDAFKKLKYLNDSFKNLTSRFETYQSVKLTRPEVDGLLKKFAKGVESKVHLLNQVLEKAKEHTLWDVYNALTNYGEHNQRAIPVGKRINKEYDVRESSMDKIRSHDKRNEEVQDFIQSNNFLIFVHQGVSNQLRSN